MFNDLFFESFISIADILIYTNTVTLTLYRTRILLTLGAVVAYEKVIKRI